MLRGINNAYKVCGRCMREDDEREARKTRIVERMSPVCKGCPFASFHGDFYSCLSAFGTGPLTKDCLRYTAGKTLRMRVIIEEVDDDE